MPDPPSDDVVRDLLCFRLADESERARWRMSDIPWSEIDASRIGPGTLRLVREAAFSEQTTFTATRQFLAEFAHDVDFTQWVSVWFFEETRHPAVLMRWLAHFGQTFDEAFVRRGRVTTPFMKSRVGTLATNVVSEMFATASYLAMSQQTREPVLAQIARNIAADEARHANGFFAYARRAIDRADNPDAERLAVAKVLHYWLNDNAQITHPVSEARARTTANDVDGEVAGEVAIDMEKLRRKVCDRLGSLIGIEVDSPERTMDVVRTLATRVQGGGA